MIKNRVPEESARARELPETAQRTPGTVVARILRQPRDILELVRIGNAAEASLRCMLISALALGATLVLSIVVSIGMFVVLVPWAMLKKEPIGDEPAAAVLTFLLVLPTAVAALIAVAAALAGTAVGVLGLFQQGHRLLSAVGAVLNVLLLGLILFTAILTVGMAG